MFRAVYRSLQAKKTLYVEMSINCSILASILLGVCPQAPQGYGYNYIIVYTIVELTVHKMLIILDQ